MIISGNHKCTKCGSNIQWEYIVPQKYNTSYDVETIYEEKTYAKKLQMRDNNEYIFQIECKNCWETNSFEYHSDIRL